MENFWFVLVTGITLFTFGLIAGVLCERFEWTLSANSHHQSRKVGGKFYWVIPQGSPTPTRCPLCQRSMCDEGEEWRS